MSDPSLAVDQEIELFLATCRTASLATVDADGQPHAANIQYVHADGWCLHWVSSPSSAHSQHLGANPRAAITVYAHLDAPDTIHGLQLHGEVDLVIAHGQAQWHDVWDRYTAKYAFINSLPQLRAAAEKQRFYRFRPTWMRWIDNRRGFGWKVEKTLGLGQEGTK
ncbi:MAG: pyridoxamine 5'-phosphate oxidase family protein [Planctomycetota bacterium]